MNTTSKPTWSKADEQRLAELTARKSKFEAVNEAPVRAVILKIDPDLAHDGRALDALVSAYVDHAEEIRDALAPFDSGVRAPDDSTPG